MCRRTTLLILVALAASAGHGDGAGDAARALLKACGAGDPAALAVRLHGLVGLSVRDGSGLDRFLDPGLVPAAVAAGQLAKLRPERVGVGQVASDGDRTSVVVRFAQAGSPGTIAARLTFLGGPAWRLLELQEVADQTPAAPAPAAPAPAGPAAPAAPAVTQPTTPPAPAQPGAGPEVEALRQTFDRLQETWRGREGFAKSDWWKEFCLPKFCLFGPDKKAIRSVATEALPLPVLFSDSPGRMVVMRGVERVGPEWARSYVGVAIGQEVPGCEHVVVWNKTAEGWRIAGLELTSKSDLDAWTVGQALWLEMQQAINEPNRVGARKPELFLTDPLTFYSGPTSPKQGGRAGFADLPRALVEWRRQGRPVDIWDARQLGHGRTLLLIPVYKSNDSGFMWCQTCREEGQTRIRAVTVATWDGLW